MIDRLTIGNFKSIIEADVKLSNFTVLVGANGSGKSNLIQALAFLATIPRSGVAAAVNRFGGFNGMVPKAIPSGDLRKTRISLCYRALLPPLPAPYGKGLPPAAVEHQLELAYSKKEIVRVAREVITFHHVLAVAEALSPDADEETVNRILLSGPSRFVLERGPRGGIGYHADPPITRETLPAYLEWLGLPFLRDSVRSASRLGKVLESMGGSRAQQEVKTQRYQSFLDPDLPTVVDYAQQFSVFRSLLSHVRVYDLLLSALRYEQPVSESRQLSPVGLNMPSVLRYLRSNPDRDVSWNRILSTLGAIAPHVVSMRPSSLRTGKEFVEFVEATASRGVESWESSDGTLRALAILLALETHRESSTILIEEPEQNLHPWAIRAIIEHIREVIEQRDVQVVVTTHSPQVLQRVYPEEVLVATRTDEGGTRFRTLKQILPHSEIAMGEVAGLWVKGLLGGVPSDE